MSELSSVLFYTPNCRMDGRVPVITATVSFGMGVDKVSGATLQCTTAPLPGQRAAGGALERPPVRGVLLPGKRPSGQGRQAGPGPGLLQQAGL